MYAEGDSEEAKKFNSVQRGHQQALETYTQFIALSMVSGLRFPVLTSAMGALWSVARLKWADSYASGGPEKRYSGHWLGKHVWTPLISLSLMVLYVAAEIGAGKKLV